MYVEDELYYDKDKLILFALKTLVLMRIKMVSKNNVKAK